MNPYDTVFAPSMKDPPRVQKTLVNVIVVSLINVTNNLIMSLKNMECLWGKLIGLKKTNILLSFFYITTPLATKFPHLSAISFNRWKGGDYTGHFYF
jgi:hypothetical protein